MGKQNHNKLNFHYLVALPIPSGHISEEKLRATNKSIVIDSSKMSQSKLVKHADDIESKGQSRRTTDALAYSLASENQGNKQEKVIPNLYLSLNS